MRIHVRRKDSAAAASGATELAPFWPNDWPAEAEAEPNGAAPLTLAGRGALHLPLKSQASSSDSRAERMLRQVRSQIDELSQALDELGSDQGDIVRVSPAVVAESPAVAATLNPAVLVNSLVTAAETEARLETRLSALTVEIEAMRLRLEESERTRAEERGRLTTLDQVIGALHANLEDLRTARGWEALPPGERVRQLPEADDRSAESGDA